MRKGNRTGSSLLINLDIDGTYTADFQMWDVWIAEAKRRGHEVISTTMRYPHETDATTQRLVDQGVELIFTSHHAKKPFLEAMDVFPDIWIDDCPHWIFMDAPP